VKPIRPKRIDPVTLTLTPPEYFVLSRIEEPLSVDELAVMCGLQEALVREIVAQLAAKGAIDVDPDPAMLAPGQSPSLVICGASDRGRVRSNNEDAFAVVDLDSGAVLAVAEPRTVRIGARGVLIVVSDGMGGENAGEVASALVVEAVREGLSTSTKDPAADLARAVLEANARVLAAARAPGRAGMGATLVAVLVTGTTAYTAEVGDSRAYAIRHGITTAISKDQTYIRVLLDQGLLTPETAAASQARNVVLQAIGKSECLIVAQRRLALRHGDRLVLCSDGLTAYVTDSELAATMEAPLEGVCAHLVATANDRGGQDNVTVVAAHFEAPSLAAADDESVAAGLTTIREFVVGAPAPADGEPSV
jgi:PPM family protein phosphatase